MYQRTITVLIFINGVILGDMGFKKDNTQKINAMPCTSSAEKQVQKVKQKEYDIVNILSENVQFFNNLTLLHKIIFTRKSTPNLTSERYATLYHENQFKELFQLPRIRATLQPLTHSYMEFYYLDNLDDDNKEKKKSIFTKINTPELYSIKRNAIFLRPSLFLPHANYTNYNISPEMWHTTKLSKTAKLSDNETSATLSLGHRICEFYACNLVTNSKTTNYKTLSHASKKGNMKLITQEKSNIEKKVPSIPTKTFSQKFEYTTAYDRIKFFEMYDSDTYPQLSTPMIHKLDENESNYDYSRNEVNLSDVNDFNNHDHYFPRQPKKYVTRVDRSSNTLKTFNVNKFALSNKIKSESVTSFTASTVFLYLSKQVSWSDFPFVAVYVYEPAQVYCDCAAISPHWLVSSATCLYLHHRVIRTEGRSAFVSYCGNNWRRPERVAYVKRSLLHPRFKPLDKSRRQLYNIGLIQIINSMADTCNGWHPVSLMSHQFVAGRDGTLATAVGWGLDRYDTRYTSSELPLHSLMLYKGLVYSDSCPGNSDYSEAKLISEDSVKNVYCLKLPTYIMEENDSVHGSLLLVEGKLIAFYLQEERRKWGEQSAQYTGIWRLIPWLLKVAQETDEQSLIEI